MLDGINYIMTLLLPLNFAQKNTVNLIGDHNNWEVNSASFMNLSTDSTYWWKTISGLVPGQLYTYQYLVDGTIKIADPFSPLILDPNNDNYIGNLAYLIHSYPEFYQWFCNGHATGKTPYNWTPPI